MTFTYLVKLARSLAVLVQLIPPSSCAAIHRYTARAALRNGDGNGGVRIGLGCTFLTWLAICLCGGGVCTGTVPAVVQSKDLS